jgi:hypothetical protein
MKSEPSKRRAIAATALSFVLVWLSVLLHFLA